MTYTLGGASIRIDEEGNVIVTDQYDAEKFLVALLMNKCTDQLEIFFKTF